MQQETRAYSSICYFNFLSVSLFFYLLVLRCKVTTIFGINGVLTQEFYSCFFQVLYFRFVTLRFKHQNSHTYRSKLWEFWGKSMALLGAKPQGYECQVGHFV